METHFPELVTTFDVLASHGKIKELEENYTSIKTLTTILIVRKYKINIIAY